MADYTYIDPNTLLPGEPWTSAKALAAFENPQAIAQGTVDAPIVRPAWHPYDSLLAGDGGTGLLYDVAVSGAAATITTPAFEDGYEYRALLLGMLASGPWQLRVELQRSSDSTFQASANKLVTDSNSGTYSFQVDFPLCRLSMRQPIVGVVAPFAFTGAAGFDLGATTKVLAARFSPSGAATFTTGKVYLQRRWDYTTA